MAKVILFLIILTIGIEQPGFLSQQKKFERVRIAFSEKEKAVESNLRDHQLTTSGFNLLIISYKEEMILELYGKGKSEESYRHLKSFDVCAQSGALGPKRKLGDQQVPEGFYFVDRFNPSSNFYLSLGLNYPNKADQIKSKAGNLGGDIFIHGNCVTIGCLPMTDDIIKEIYVYAVHAKNNGQEEIPVYIFPFRMTDENYNRNRARYEHLHDVVEFWKNLREGYRLFSETKKEIRFEVSRTGEYVYLR